MIDKIEIQFNLARLRNLGNDCLKYYHNEMIYNFPQSYKWTFNQLVDFINSKNRSTIAQIGSAIESIDMSEKAAGQAMEKLSLAGKGQIAYNSSSFLQALNDEYSKLDLVDALGDTAIETAKDLAKGAQRVGDVVIDTGKNILDVSTWAIPLLIFGGAAFFIFNKAKA